MSIKKFLYKYSFLFLVIFILQSCGGGSGGGTAVPVNDVTPNTLGFDSITDVELSTVTVSNVITISGIDSDAPISIIGGEYSINGDSFTNVNSIISNGQTVQVRQTSSNSTSSTTDVTLTVGGLSGKFSITTRVKLPSAKIIVSPTSLNLTESASQSPIVSGIINVRLNIEPTGSVVISAISLDTTIAIVNPKFAPITFNASDWNVDKSIPISSIDDAIAGGVRTTSINISVSNTGTNYDKQSTFGEVIVDDDDLVGITVKIKGVNLLSLGNIDETLSKQFTVELTSEPLTDIVLTPGSLSNRVSVSTANNSNILIFKAATGTIPSNWNIPQDVMVTALDDGIANGDAPVSINLDVTTGDSTGYSSKLNQVISAIVKDIQVADSKEFLKFLNKSAPRNNELTGNRLTVQLSNPTIIQQRTLPNGVILPQQQIADAGAAYYAAVDPNNKRLTLADFKAFNNLKDSLGADGLANVAIYVNDADLGFGRRMYVSTNVDSVTQRTKSVASCVENYAPGGNPGAAAQDKINLAKAGKRTVTGGFVAAVCMEYSGSPGTYGTIVNPKSSDLKGRKFVKFFSYGKSISGSTTGFLDGRITEADLDGNGVKTQPGVCNTCHGGQGNSLLANGSYPLLGDTGAKFLPWDIDTFIFDGNFIPAGYQEIFNRFNQAVIDTYPKAQTFSLMQATTSSPLVAVSPGASGSSIITVPASAGITEITSIMVSIDSDLAGTGPGITNIQSERIGLKLVDPDRSLGNTAGRIGKYVDFRLPGSLSKIYGAKDLYWGDYAPYGRTTLLPDPYDNSTVFPPTNIISGIALIGDDRSFVRQPDCIKVLARDFGCRSAQGTTGLPNTGKWELVVTNANTVAVPPALPVITELKSWSIHFNGIPEKIYLPATVELIRGWYGGINPTTGRLNPTATFNKAFVPDGWKFKTTNGTGTVVKVAGAPDPALLYSKVIAPSCRACHIVRGEIQGNDIDFSTYAKFMKYKDRIKNLVFDKGLMPLAKRTYQNRFWKYGSGQPEELALHILPANTPLTKPGRNIANAGSERIGNYAIQFNGPTTVNLNGRGSLFNNGKFSWIVTTSSQVPVTVKGANTATPSFIASTADTYNVTLDTSANGNSSVGSLTRSSIKIQLLASAPPSSVYTKDIAVSYNSTTTLYSGALVNCNSSYCHSSQTNESALNQQTSKFLFGNRYTLNQNPFPAAEFNEVYRILRDRINIFSPDDSLIISKAFGIVNHAGTTRRRTTTPKPQWNPTNPGYIAFKRWILEGAKNDLVP